ncbi:MAG: hypothetical protein O7A68_06320, partial [Alphaproteobacteria bacterium]|nr:hypothetical protein [Alphaproteobacteria bacterium]
MTRRRPSAAPAGLGGEAFPELDLQHLAIVVLGQRVDEAIGPGPLEAGDVVETEGVEVALAKAR